MPKPFKVAFIGAGGIARTHMKYLKPLENVEVVAAADPSEMSLKKLKEEYPQVKQFTDYKTMLKEIPDIDAIDVCTPNGLHAENTIAALDAGKDVMVEKPMAMNAVEAQRMLDAAKRNNKQK